MKYKLVVLAVCALFPVLAHAEGQIARQAKNPHLVITIEDKFFYFFGYYPNQATKDDVYKKMEEINSELIQAGMEIEIERQAYQAAYPFDLKLEKCSKNQENLKCERLRQAQDRYDYLLKRGVAAYDVQKLAGFDWEPSQ